MVAWPISQQIQLDTVDRQNFISHVTLIILAQVDAKELLAQLLKLGLVFEIEDVLETVVDI